LNFGGTKEGEDFLEIAPGNFNSKYHTWGRYRATQKKVKGLKMTFSGPKMTISGYHIYGIRPNAYDLKTKFDSTSILIGYHF
jgi:hypothetical protein